ncbi:HD domain-containing phosphohydrolase [Methylobacterium sp. 1030]|uniref:HD-GYP domain-containing protein n=1 Tax=Methylobacterium sp. 1030 TaxID=3156404 RepID=UPI0033939A07
MPFRSVVMLTDRPDRGRALADAARSVTHCRVAGLADDWDDLDHVRGLIADVSVERVEARRCFGKLSDRLSGRPLPMVFVMQSMRGGELRQAERLGATACFPPQTLASTLVTGLFRQIAPGKAMTDLLIEHSFNRAGLLFTDMFDAARHGRVNLEAIDDEIDPVLSAVKVGGVMPWLELVRAHDDMTVRHCLLVAGLAAHFALHLGLSIDDRTSLVRGALVHDVGKAKIPLAILQKPAPLDADELTVMRTHAALGHDMLMNAGITDAIALAVTRHHHEMLDGSGYPDGLSGTSISDPVRLLTVCDIYAALIEHRPYRPAMAQAEAIAVLRRMAPDRLETALVEAFAASLIDGQTAARSAEVESGRS